PRERTGGSNSSGARINLNSGILNPDLLAPELGPEVATVWGRCRLRDRMEAAGTGMRSIVWGVLIHQAGSRTPAAWGLASGDRGDDASITARPAKNPGALPGLARLPAPGAPEPRAACGGTGKGSGPEERDRVPTAFRGGPRSGTALAATDPG